MKTTRRSNKRPEQAQVIHVLFERQLLQHSFNAVPEYLFNTKRKSATLN